MINKNSVMDNLHFGSNSTKQRTQVQKVMKVMLHDFQKLIAADTHCQVKFH